MQLTPVSDYDGELGGKHVRLTGSADQIISQFNKLYPDSAINVTSPITGGYGAYYKNQVVFKRNKVSSSFISSPYIAASPNHLLRQANLCLRGRLLQPSAVIALPNHGSTSRILLSTTPSPPSLFSIAA